MTSNIVVGDAIAAALDKAGLSQRAAAARTGISQPTLSRVISGQRTATMPEILLLADATGHTVAQLTGTAIADRVECAARGTNGANMEQMRRQLLYFIELHAHLDDYAIPQPH